MKDEEISIQEIVIKIGRRTLTLPVEKARKLYKALDSIFGDHSYTWAVYPSVTYPKTGTLPAEYTTYNYNDPKQTQITI